MKIICFKTKRSKLISFHCCVCVCVWPLPFSWAFPTRDLASSYNGRFSHSSSFQSLSLFFFSSSSCSPVHNLKKGKELLLGKSASLFSLPLRVLFRFGSLGYSSRWRSVDMVLVTWRFSRFLKNYSELLMTRSILTRRRLGLFVDCIVICYYILLSLLFVLLPP